MFVGTKLGIDLRLCSIVPCEDGSFLVDFRISGRVGRKSTCRLSAFSTCNQAAISMLILSPLLELMIEICILPSLLAPRKPRKNQVYHPPLIAAANPT